MKRHCNKHFVFLFIMISTLLSLSGIKRELVLVEQGNYVMGDWLPVFNIPDGYDNIKDLTGEFGTDITFDARFLHNVTLAGYYISPYEVTFQEFDEYCLSSGDTLHFDEGWGRGERPVIHVSWYDAIKYCNWLSSEDGLNPCYEIDELDVFLITDANGYRLPTEAEWEYAARGGQFLNSDLNDGYGNIFSGTSQENEVPQYIWFRNNSIEEDDEPGEGRSHPVGQKSPNELGLYDMSGNVWEWCWDLWNPDYYEYCNQNPEESVNPNGFYEPYNDGDHVYQYAHVLRGASWANLNPFYRNTFRFFSQRQVLTNDPNYKNWRIGFRICRSNIETDNLDSSYYYPETEISFFPNPIRLNKGLSESVLINYRIMDISPIKIDFFNIKGQLIDTFSFKPEQQSGTISLKKDKIENKFSNTGVYLYRVSTGKNQITGKILIIK